MKKQWLVVLFVASGVSLGITAGADCAAAQGPAGAGAGAPTVATEKSHSSHSLNPIKWVKKDSKSSTDSVGARSEAEKKLTAKLQAQSLLPANANATDSCAPFRVLEDCVAALHASHNLGLDFNCLRFDVTGVHTNADLSGCKNPGSDKALSLTKAINLLKPDANAKDAAKSAEQQAKEDLKDLGA